MPNREIKFRVWDKKVRIMESWDDLAFRTDPTLEQVLRNNYKQYELMQFTGLKDSKGVEIWEGDILSIGFAEGNRYNAPVTYDIKEARFDAKGKGIKVAELGWLKNRSGFDLKVIGNIYENSNLLK